MKNKFADPGAVRPIAAATIFVVCLVFAPLFGQTAHAAVAGQCALCHTMHNSQGGSLVVSDGPHASLLVNDCVGCHSATDSGTAIDGVTGAPIVYNTGGAPTYGPDSTGLAGGNFYWVAQGDDSKGHNVFSDNADDNLSSAPGHVVSGCGTESCHDNLHAVNTNYGTRQGCTKCHMMGNAAGPKGYHHKDDTGPIIDSADEGWFRFLEGHQGGAGHGVSGIEDDDWLFTSSSTDHNEYLGYSGTKTSAAGLSSLGNTMTGYCCGCHSNFHTEENAGGDWIRHPSDAVIPNSGEYASAYGAVGGTGAYDALVPVARPSLTDWTQASSDVRIGTDLVMCLSCHKAHGSPYPDMLRWDYDQMIAGNPAKTGGCFTCHTGKND
jgi:hypothetical protein